MNISFLVILFFIAVLTVDFISGAFVVMFDEKSGAEKACGELQDDMIMKVNQARVRGIVSSSI